MKLRTSVYLWEGCISVKYLNRKFDFVLVLLIQHSNNQLNCLKLIATSSWKITLNYRRAIMLVVHLDKIFIYQSCCSSPTLRFTRQLSSAADFPLPFAIVKYFPNDFESSLMLHHGSAAIRFAFTFFILLSQFSFYGSFLLFNANSRSICAARF